MMLATIHSEHQATTVTITRELTYPIDHVWGMLTENNKLHMWFSELTILDLRTDGQISFDFQNGQFEYMRIIKVDAPNILSFSWANDTVTFILEETKQGTSLTFEEKIRTLTEHTAKDITGWHVCLDCIEKLLQEKPISNRMEHWQALFPQYQHLLASYK